MKKILLYKTILILLLSILFSVNVFSQNFSVSVDQNEISDTLGTEMTFHVTLTNLSASELTLSMVRIENDLPLDWSSSMCLELCFSSHVDSIATTPDFSSKPLEANESRELKVIVFPKNNYGSGKVKIKISDLNNKSDNVEKEFFVSTNTTSVDENKVITNNYYLEQNYPNPFNPSTTINFQTPKAGFVTIKIYDVMGKELGLLVDEYKESGNHRINFDASNFSSGVYFYKMRSNDFLQMKKMLLVK